MRILVADDDPMNRQLALAMVRRLGHQASGVEDGRELVAFLEQNAVDLVLVDVHMPVMDGIDAVREVIRRIPLERRPIIIAVSAATDDRTRSVCRDVGMNGFLPKPVSLKVLADFLDVWTGRGIDSLSQQPQSHHSM